jgi:hypothetical protein
MRSFFRKHRRCPGPASLATLFALGCCTVQAACDSDRSHGVAARAVQTASAPVPSVVAPVALPSPSAVVPSEELTVEEERCPPNADCLPEPYNGSEDMVVGTVAGAPYKYRASRKRYPLRGRTQSEGGVRARRRLHCPSDL